MKRTIYFYRYTTNPGAIKQYGSNFIVFKDKILEENENEYILELYEHIRKYMVDSLFFVMNESTNDDINYTWFSLNNNKDRMNTFKRLVREKLTQYEDKVSEELNYVRGLLNNIKEEK